MELIKAIHNFMIIIIIFVVVVVVVVFYNLLLTVPGIVYQALGFATYGYL